MVFIPWREIQDLADNNPAIDLARATVALACRVRQAVPGIFDVYTNVAGTNPVLPAPALNRFFWDNACRDDPLPLPEAENAPFYGGQCPIRYGVQGILVRTDLGGEQATGLFVDGPIQRLFIRRAVTPGSAGIRWTLNVAGNDGILITRTIGDHLVTANPVTRYFTRVFPENGSIPDNCGNRTFIPSLPAVPPSTFNVPITFGGTERNVQITLPTLETGDWPSFEWSPSISFDGITVDLGIDGINIDFGDNPVLPEIRPEGGGDNTQILNELTQIRNETQTINETVNNITNNIQGDANVDLTEILELIKCCCCEDSVSYVTQPVASNVAGGVYPIPENTLFVLVTGTEFDIPRTKKQGGGGDSPDVYYWGHAAVCYGSADGGERIPLQFKSQSFPVSEGATKFLFSPYYEARGTIVAVVKEKNCHE